MFSSSANAPPGPSGEPLRPMNNMPTYRRGRRVYRPGPNDAGGVGGACSVLFVILLLAVPPAAFVLSESARRGAYVALKEALESDVRSLSETENAPREGDLVHASSTDVTAVSSDPDMRVSVPGALTLRRQTEYCQWQEIRRNECETCTRSVRASDGTTKDETFQCNCVTYYDYVKAWRGHRINSFAFDQPAAHHNPQRDPMPRRTFAADGAVVRVADGGQNRAPAAAVLDPSMLSNGVRGARWRTVNFVPHGTPPVPSFWTRWMPDRTRYEPTEALKDITRAPAATQDNFMYVGQGGYFFSPYNAGNAENLFKYFMQYMEGTLLDWQVGDLMPSCTAGDVRFRYEVQDPAEVSILGEAAGTTQLAAGRETAVILRPKVARNDYSVGLVHAGRSSVPSMIAAEDSDSRWKAAFPRLLLLLWSIAATRLLGALVGRDVGGSSRPAQVAAVLALWSSVVGTVWVFHWGWTGDGAMEGPFLLLGAAALGVTASGRLERSDVPGGLNAAWCMLGRWANVPPSWRVESSYGEGAHGKRL